MNQTGENTAPSTGKQRVFVAGHKGMVGSALVRRLQSDTSVEFVLRDRSELDLLAQSEVEQFFSEQAVDHVYLAAAKVGGILANRDFPADFIRENLQIQTNVIHAAHLAGVKRLLFLGSSCIYPRLAPQPLVEDALLSGPLESTNEAYAVAKIAGIRMCEAYHRQYGSDFRSIMPTNLYGPNDNFDLDSSHVLPALLRKFYEAVLHRKTQVQVWGTGNPRREFLHVDDMAVACCRIMQISEEDYWSVIPEHNSQVNVGCGEDISIGELARIVAELTGFEGKIVFDSSRPDGTHQKLLDISRITALGWAPQIPLRKGIQQTLEWMRYTLRGDGPEVESGSGAS